MIKKISFFVVMLFIALSSFINISNAENIFDSGNNISLKMSPEDPEPNSEVSVLLSSFSFDLDIAKTKVKVNGKVILDTYSVREFSFKTKNNGEEVLIEIESVTNEGLVYKTTKRVIPESVDLLYESYDSYRPPFYEGGSDILSDAKVKIIAMPEIYDKKGRKIATSDLVYKWNIDNVFNMRKSGYGKNVFYIDRIKAAPIKTKITVNVSTRDGLISASKTILINPKEAKPYMYLVNSPEDFSLRNPIVGGKISVENYNIFVRSNPYFMNDIGNKSLIRDTWTINGVNMEENEGDSVIFIENDGIRTGGIRHLKMTFLKDIANSYRPLQYAREIATVEFEKVQREYYSSIDDIKMQNADPIGTWLFK